MKWIIFFIFYPVFVRSEVPVHWSTVVEIVERHEFYQNNEVIMKPKGSWEKLFGILYLDRNLNLHKDCVFYYVPNEAPGVLKIKTIDPKVSCENVLDQKGDIELSNLRALQFSLVPKEISLHFTLQDFTVTSWRILVANNYERVTARPFLSSAEYRAPKMIYLAPLRVASSITKGTLEKNSLCHSISDQCEELSPSICGQCDEGWYEIPNGCSEGPKYCGNIQCGLKNRPACRRGMVYQRVDKKYECRTDSSFAYCADGLKVQCEGNLPYCR